MFRSNNGYIANNVYKKYGNRTFNNTNSITKHINNYSNDVTNNYKINEISNVKQAYYNFNGDITLNKASNQYSNGTYNIIKTNNTFDTTDSQYFSKKIEHESITNNVTRHSRNNYEHNAINKVHKHIKHINNYDTGINYHSKKSLNKKNYYNFYNDKFNFRKIENISISPQADITNNITETNTQTINYIGNN